MNFKFNLNLKVSRPGARSLKQTVTNKQTFSVCLFIIIALIIVATSYQLISPSSKSLSLLVSRFFYFRLYCIDTDRAAAFVFQHLQRLKFIDKFQLFGFTFTWTAPVKTFRLLTACTPLDLLFRLVLIQIERHSSQDFTWTAPVNSSSPVDFSSLANTVFRTSCFP